MKQSNCYNHVHVILVPGFGAFDALGRVEYYSGITRLYHEWNRNRLPVTLHDFKNLPTAAVSTRATKLRGYLGKRIARGEILDDDAIVLVGHSTGGLDIRQLICDLHKRKNKRFYVDGGYVVTSQQIRERLKGVVFLSVPHRGTNIADWVHSHNALCQGIIAELRAAVASSPLDILETLITGSAAELTGSGMLLALKDALTEADEHYGKPSPLRSSQALQVASDLALYFRQMWSDFDVIYDLACHRYHSDRKSPAQFDEAERTRELALWADPPIKALSYATVGSRAFSFPPGEPAPAWELTSPGPYIDLIKSFWRKAKNDLSYELCYRACAGGPFRLPKKPAHISRVLGLSPPLPLEAWDNDGIVNTVSMFWPKGDNVLVMADHLDVVGHYRLVRAPYAKRAKWQYGVAREYQSYDCLRSTPRFTKKMFADIWTEIFDFAANATGVARARASRGISASIPRSPDGPRFRAESRM